MAFVPPRDRVLEHSTSNSQTVFAVTGAVDTSFNAFFGIHEHRGHHDRRRRRGWGRLQGRES